MKNWKSMLLFLVLAIGSVAWAEDRSRVRSLDDCSATNEFVLNSETSISYPFFTSSTQPSSCGRRPSPDRTFELIVTETGLYSIGVPGNVWLYLTTECCGGDQLFPRGLVENYNFINCAWLEVGTYYLTVEGSGELNLFIVDCADPCDNSFVDGFSYEGTFATYVETVDANSSEPNYSGPWQTDGPPCQDESANEDGDMVGFGYYNWYNQDFGWSHFFSVEGIDCIDYTIDSACVVICAYENDFCGEGEPGPAREASRCQWDDVYIDNGIRPSGILNPYNDPGNNLSMSMTKIRVPLGDLEDGQVDVFMDLDAASTQCAWATAVISSKLVVYITCSQTPPEPEGYDLGDLPNQNEAGGPCYPTNSPANGGPANAVFAADEQVAWLGECVTHEPSPNTVDNDGCDDGIIFVPSSHSGGSWMPGELVCIQATITTGPAYQQGTPLYLWAWKDGNLDCDFDDFFEFSSTVASECIISGNEYFAPGPNSTFTVDVCFIDPGTTEFGRYDGKLRFRLLSCGGETPSRTGDLLNCLTAQTYVDEVLGETEDYIVTDLQLPVELMSFTASGASGRVVLSWITATENQNDAFEVQKWNSAGWVRAGDRVSANGTSSSQHSYHFVDSDVTVGETYRYRLVTIDVNGNRMTAGEVESLVEPVSATVEKFALSQNFPNPFNPTTEIMYDIAEATDVNLTVFDLLGREVATLVNGHQNSGRYTVSFDATGLPSGMYFYRLETAEFSDMKKMMLLK